jgi:acyl-CoA carboxylase epsilon subunit-like protein
MSEADAVATVQVVGGRVSEEEVAALVAVLELIAAGRPAPAGGSAAAPSSAASARWRRLPNASPQSWAQAGGGWG